MTDAAYLASNRPTIGEGCVWLVDAAKTAFQFVNGGDTLNRVDLLSFGIEQQQRHGVGIVFLLKSLAFGRGHIRDAEYHIFLPFQCFA